MVTRRLVTALLGLGALVPLACLAQKNSPKKVARVGVLGAGTAVGWAKMVDAFRSGMRGAGYVEGDNLAIDYRWADGKYDRLGDLAAELIRLKVDVIVTHGTLATRAAKHATSTVPIVMASNGDPVFLGLIGNLARPGGNISGLAFFSRQIAEKRLEILKEVMSGLDHAVYLTDSGAAAFNDEIKSAAQKLKVSIQVVNIDSMDELENLFVATAKRRMPILIYESPLLIANAKAVGEALLKHRVPCIAFKEIAEAGGLLAYGADIADMWRRSAAYVDKILKGTKPGDLPVEQASKFELIVNMDAARALGVRIPHTVLVRADKVIQ